MTTHIAPTFCTGCSVIAIHQPNKKSPGQSIRDAQNIQIPAQLLAKKSVLSNRKKTAAIAKPRMANRRMVLESLLIALRLHREQFSSLWKRSFGRFVLGLTSRFQFSDFTFPISFSSHHRL